MFHVYKATAQIFGGAVQDSIKQQALAASKEQGDEVKKEKDDSDGQEKGTEEKNASNGEDGNGDGEEESKESDENEDDGEEKPTGGNDNEDEDGDEDVDNLQLAWECLELVRIALETEPETKWQVMRSDAHLNLANIALEQGQYFSSLPSFPISNIQIESMMLWRSSVKPLKSVRHASKKMIAILPQRAN